MGDWLWSQPAWTHPSALPLASWYLGQVAFLLGLVSSYDEAVPWESDAVADVKVLDWDPYELGSARFSQETAQGLRKP